MWSIGYLAFPPIVIKSLLNHFPDTFGGEGGEDQVFTDFKFNCIYVDLIAGSLQ